MITILSPYPGYASGIILPSPQWNDSSSSDSKVNILRALNGTYWSYIKQSSIQKLAFSVLLTNEKADEFQDFFYAQVGERMSLEWNDIFIGTFEQAPLQFNNDRRGVYGDSTETVSCNFSFIGIKQ